MLLNGGKLFVLVGGLGHGELLVETDGDLVAHGDAGEEEAHKGDDHGGAHTVIEQKGRVDLLEPEVQEGLNEKQILKKLEFFFANKEGLFLITVKL